MSSLFLILKKDTIYTFLSLRHPSIEILRHLLLCLTPTRVPRNPHPPEEWVSPVGRGASVRPVFVSQTLVFGKVFRLSTLHAPRTVMDVNLPRTAPERGTSAYVCAHYPRTLSFVEEGPNKRHKNRLV